MPRLLRQIGVDENVFFKHCNASYKLGAARNLAKSEKPFGEDEAANESYDRMRKHALLHLPQPNSC